MTGVCRIQGLLSKLLLLKVVEISQPLFNFPVKNLE